jgi:quinoprotein glucose dehydrogenase
MDFSYIPLPANLGMSHGKILKLYLCWWRQCWGGFCLDKERGIVFTGTGSATPDFYGGNRKGNNLFANSVLALDASTGV